VKYLEIFNANTSKIKLVGVYPFVDRVLQLQMLTFLDPLIDAVLPENFYGYRRGRSSLQAIAYLFKRILLSDTFKYHLVFVSIQKCFDFISHKVILNKFIFPKKYKYLLVRWVKCICELESGKKIKMLYGVSRGFILGPMICNFILGQVVSNFFEGLNFYNKHNLKHLDKPKCSFTHTASFIMGYGDDFIIRVTSSNEVSSVLKKLKSMLLEAGLVLNNKNSYRYDFKIRISFNWLGYTFLVFSSKKTRYTG
jgi:retron-type reverse transcriptase